MVFEQLSTRSVWSQFGHVVFFNSVNSTSVATVVIIKHLDPSVSSYSNAFSIETNDRDAFLSQRYERNLCDLLESVREMQNMMDDLAVEVAVGLNLPRLSRI